VFSIFTLAPLHSLCAITTSLATLRGSSNESGTTALTNSASKITCATAKYVTEKNEQVYCISAVHENNIESHE
jgi:hypothetical protein